MLDYSSVAFVFVDKNRYKSGIIAEFYVSLHNNLV